MLKGTGSHQDTKILLAELDLGITSALTPTNSRSAGPGLVGGGGQGQVPFRPSILARIRRITGQATSLVVAFGALAVAIQNWFPSVPLHAVDLLAKVTNRIFPSPVVSVEPLPHPAPPPGVAKELARQAQASNTSPIPFFAVFKDSYVHYESIGESGKPSRFMLNPAGNQMPSFRELKVGRLLQATTYVRASIRTNDVVSVDRHA